VDLQAHEKDMYSTLFEQADIDRDGYVGAPEAVEFLRKSDLNNNQLADVTLSSASLLPPFIIHFISEKDLFYYYRFGIWYILTMRRS